MEGRRHLALGAAGADRLSLPPKRSAMSADVLHPSEHHDGRHLEKFGAVVSGELLRMGTTECSSPFAYVRGALGLLFLVPLVPRL